MFQEALAVIRILGHSGMEEQALQQTQHTSITLQERIQFSLRLRAVFKRLIVIH
jgi:hypothetical protein